MVNKISFDILKRDVAKLQSVNAPDEDIDQHVRESGWTPDDFIKQAKTEIPITNKIPEQKSIGGFMSNIPKSAMNSVVNPVVQLATHPIKTVESIANVAGGAMEDLPIIRNLFGENTHKKDFESVLTYFKNRYGSLDKAKETGYKDPVGFATDLATLVSGAGGALKGGATAALKAGDIAAITRSIGGVQKAAQIAEGLQKAGSMVGKVGEAINPMTYPLKAAQLPLKGLSKLAAPVAGGFQPETAQAFTRQGITPTAGMVNKSPIVGIGEAIATKGLFGSGMTKLYEATTGKMMGIVDDTLKKIGASTDPIETGKTIANGLSDFRSKFFDMKNQLYENTDVYNITTKIDAPETIKFLDTQIDKLSKSALTPPELKTLKTLKESLSGKKPISIGEAASTLQVINSRLKDFSGIGIQTGEKAVLGKIATTLDKEIDLNLSKVRPDLKSNIDKANAFYSDGIDKMNTATGGKVKGFLEDKQYDKVASAILNSNTSIMDIPKLYETVGPEAKQAIQVSIFKEIFDKAKGNKEIWTGNSLGFQINKYGISKLQDIFIDRPEIVDTLQDLEKISKAVDKGKWIGGGSQTAFIGKAIAEGGILLHNPVAGAIMVLGDLGYSKFIASEIGQQWLKNGYKFPVIEKATETLNSATPMLTKAALLNKINAENNKQKGQIMNNAFQAAGQ